MKLPATCLVGLILTTVLTKSCQGTSATAAGGSVAGAGISTTEFLKQLEQQQRQQQNQQQQQQQEYYVEGLENVDISKELNVELNVGQSQDKKKVQQEDEEGKIIFQTQDIVPEEMMDTEDTIILRQERKQQQELKKLLLQRQRQYRQKQQRQRKQGKKDDDGDDFDEDDYEDEGEDVEHEDDYAEEEEEEDDYEDEGDEEQGGDDDDDDAAQEVLAAKPAKCLIFEDNFDRLDVSVWKHDITLTGGGNYEFQIYHNNRTNTFVEDGIFYIKPTLTENRIGTDRLFSDMTMDMWGQDPGTQCTGNFEYGCLRVAGAGGNILNPVQSGMVRSVNSFKFRYGRVEVRAKMPKGKWIWPAIWMLPADYQYGNWPASGEIDLVESRGNDPSYSGGGYDKVASTLHWGPSYEFNRFQTTHQEYQLSGGRSFTDDFHIFTLDWTAQGIKTFVDGDLVLNVPFQNMFTKGQFPDWVNNPWKGSNAAPFDQEFYLIMNVAIGGTAGFFPDGQGGKPWSDHSEHAVNEFYAAKGDWYPTWGSEQSHDRAMAVDYIRVYKDGC